jgi:hypothetical protein
MGTSIMRLAKTAIYPTNVDIQSRKLAHHVSQPLVVDDTEENFCLKINTINEFFVIQRKKLAGNKSKEKRR